MKHTQSFKDFLNEGKGITLSNDPTESELKEFFDAKKVREDKKIASYDPPESKTSYWIEHRFNGDFWFFLLPNNNFTITCQHEVIKINNKEVNKLSEFTQDMVKAVWSKAWSLGQNYQKAMDKTMRRR